MVRLRSPGKANAHFLADNKGVLLSLSIFPNMTSQPDSPQVSPLIYVVFNVNTSKISCFSGLSKVVKKNGYSECFFIYACIHFRIPPRFDFNKIIN